ncbi:MAG: phosphoribosylanthranilate isomerase [Rhizomicrobium sp.]|jgi:phosphoribosylanthranilate isomerase
MAVQVKICGVTSVGAADAAVRAGADFVGFVFHPASPRHLTPAQAAQLAQRLRGSVRLAVLLSDPLDEELASVVEATRPDFIQLHGREAPERVAVIRTQFGRPVIKAIPIAEASDFACVARYEPVADLLLFDAKPPAAAGREGGHGAPFDWQLLRGRSFKRPWLLAGGLNTENVARAIRTADAPGVDVSSGVETSPGIKSADLITAFIAAARSAEFAEGQGT